LPFRAGGGQKIGRVKIEEVSNLARALEVLSLSEREALRAGEEMGYLEPIGVPIDLRDVLIEVVTRGRSVDSYEKREVL
jgi:predicted nucleic acid-binding protein